ncbi:hypothetical protein LWC34_38985 [Kibdelosporangium philippinense]|uniref:Uncharacterized protein n=1 Tax=Kibdelosporangium philippinense TaxID=211113 RepID=A0ABS8ZQ51_9PSEU|nr:hypothetical protein [Kibdelosporangium philippinense]MCE7008756.1 hypothetical protein [Kibdelosporangium philippinense]
MPEFPAGARVQIGERFGRVHRDLRTIAVRIDDGRLGYFVPEAVRLVDEPLTSEEPR